MQRRTLMFLLIGGLATAFAFLALCSGGVYLAYRAISGTAQEASAKVDELFAAFAANDRTAYDRHTTVSFKQVTSQQQFDAIGTLVNDRLGTLQSKTTTTCNVRSINGESFADVAYNATFEKGAGTISARLQKEGGDWRFVTINVQSPKLLTTLATEKCTACGNTYVPGAKFCPHCGKELLMAEQP